MIHHKHHIIPKHMGGTDDPSNLITVTTAQHAHLHRILYEVHGKEQDRIAWLGLSGRIGKEEAIALAALLGAKKPQTEEGKRKISAFRKTFRYSEESKRKISMAKKGSKLTEEHKRKVSLALMGHVQPESQKQKVAEKLSRSYQITNPDGETFVIKNLSKFCRENNLDQGNMSRNHVRGWSCQKIA